MTRRGRTIHRADTTAKALKAAALKLGASVMPIDGIVDCLIFHKGRVLLIDWKSKGGGMTPDQIKYTSNGWPICYVSDINQLVALLSRDER